MMQVCPLDDESRDRLADRITEFERTLSCLFAAIDSSEIARLAALPDVLDIPNFGLYGARLVLLYRLGYSEILRVDGSFPADRPEQELAAMVGELAAMPAAKSLPDVVLVLDDQLTSLATTILGVRITVVFDCSLEGFLAAEAHISALEGFAATLLNSGAFPHLEAYVIEISRTPVSEASVSLRDDGSMLIQLPDVWSPSDRLTTSHYNAHLVHVVGLAICAIAVLPDAETTIKTLIEKDRALERSTYFCHSGNSHSRVFGTRTGRLGDFNDLVGEEYPLKDGAGAIGSFREKSVSKKAKIKPVEDKEFRDPKSHKDLIVNSIINMKLWDEATWRGLGYTWDPGYLPIAGLMFQNERSGLAIFEEWGKRFGRDDKDDRIRVSVVRGIDFDNRSYYRGHISPNINNAELQVGKTIISSSRKMVMEVENQNHLNSFIQRFNETRSYLLVPLVPDLGGQFQIRLEVAIRKSHFHVRELGRLVSMIPMLSL